jgi:hypothetical protein
MGRSVAVAQYAWAYIFGIVRTAFASLLIYRIYRVPVNGVQRKAHIIVSPASAVAVRVAVYNISLDADCRSSASFSSGGNFLPRRSALRRIPSQAFALK